MSSLKGAKSFSSHIVGFVDANVFSGKKLIFCCIKLLQKILQRKIIVLTKITSRQQTLHFF